MLRGVFYKMKKINLNKEHRLKEINNLACMIQDTKLKSIGEIRKIAETIELLSDDKILKGLNNFLEDFKKGKFISIEKLDENKRTYRRIWIKGHYRKRKMISLNGEERIVRKWCEGSWRKIKFK